jgi:hemerythrin-like domain-containing protein
MRYRFYREHKYVSSALNDLERIIAQADFTQNDVIAQVKTQFEKLAAMLTEHARYENERVHQLLRVKKSDVFQGIEEEHEHHKNDMLQILGLFKKVEEESIGENRILKGYELYLAYRKFVANNLLHLHEEETNILPELQRLYSDDELRQVAAVAYNAMTPEQIVSMLEGLFVHMNTHDRYAFLENIHILVPQKLSLAWPRIREILSDQEQHTVALLVSS